MPSNEQFKRHAILVDRMAETLGVDLQEKVLRGETDMVEIEEAVFRCTACTDPGTCAHWLDAAQGVQEQTPPYCRNAGMMAALKG